MPIYDYICHDCLGEHDKGDIRCPKCESKNIE